MGQQHSNIQSMSQFEKVDALTELGSIDEKAAKLMVEMFAGGKASPEFRDVLDTVKSELTRNDLATKSDLTAAVSGLASKIELDAAVSGLATKVELDAAVSGLESKIGLIAKDLSWIKIIGGAIIVIEILPWLKDAMTFAG